MRGPRPLPGPSQRGPEGAEAIRVLRSAQLPTTRVVPAVEEEAAPEVTSTATWDQAAGTWDASATETIPSTGSWSQDATWQASASEEVAASAAFVQSATWQATASEEIAGSGAFAQSATWDAAATEAIPSTGAWSQDAAWNAEGLVANAVEATATFEQAAAAWFAATDQLITGTATFTQAAATWDAVASLAIEAAAAFLQAPAAFSANVAEELAGTAAWEQAAASWQAAEGAIVTAAGTWQQDATWGASAASAGESPRAGFSRRRQVPLRMPELMIVRSTSDFGQGPATWTASMAVDRSSVDIAELVVAGVV